MRGTENGGRSNGSRSHSAAQRRKRYDGAALARVGLLGSGTLLYRFADNDVNGRVLIPRPLGGYDVIANEHA